MKLRYLSLPTHTAESLRLPRATDAYGCEPRRLVSDGSGNPCRHCLRDIPMGRDMLLLAYRPFARLHAYAETGPVFLCAEAAGCPAPPLESSVPAFVFGRPRVLVKPYDVDEQICGAGRIVETADLEAELERMLAEKGTAFLDIRSAVNNCWFCRVERTG